MADDGTRSVRIEQQQDYRVAIVCNPERPPRVADEPPPLGRAEGPSPGQLPLGAVGNCMTDSLPFAMRKFGLDAEPLSTRVDATVGRSPQGRQRFLSIDVVLTIGKVPGDAAELARVLGQFEQFCTVGQSVAQGIPTRVSVRGPDGAVLHGEGA